MMNSTFLQRYASNEARVLSLRSSLVDNCSDDVTMSARWMGG